MRSKISVLLIVGFVGSLCLLTSLLQAEEEQKPQLNLVREITVKPSMVAQHFEARKMVVEKCKEHNFQRPFHAWHDGDFHYYYFYPVKDLGDVDNVNKEFGSIIEKWGKKEYQELGKKALAAQDSYRDYFIWALPKYAYDPEEPRLKREEMNFAIMDMYYLIPGKASDFAGFVEEWQSLLKRKNIQEAVYWFSGGIGTERPLYIAVAYGKDAADFWTHNPKMWEALGEEGTKLYRKSMQLVKRNKLVQLYYLKNLSYFPEEK